MSYLYESTKFDSLAPLANSTAASCWSIFLYAASWVKTPSLSVRRQELLPALPIRVLLITVAVSKNRLICSLVRVGSSAPTLYCRTRAQTSRRGGKDRHRK